jgi:outer membrane receptor protein involved in Fe transport
MRMRESAVAGCRDFRASIPVLMILFVVLVWSCCPALAQVDQGSFVGYVTDPSGATIAGAKVDAKDIGTNVVISTTTSSQGYYEFPLLPVGRYVISVENTGFRQTVTPEMELHAGTKPRVDLAMQVGAVSQVVTVAGGADLINATTADLSTVIDDVKVEDLPLNGRSFTQLFTLQNGSNPTGGQSSRGGAEFNGASSSGNNFLMDGVDMSFGELSGIGIAAIGGTGNLINTLSVDAIEEFKNTSGGYDAEYGHSSGAVINVTTKSGSNTFHGAAWEYFRNDALDANTYFSDLNGLTRPELRQNQFGAKLGGPILKDKIFFFFNYEGARVERGTLITGNVPTPFLLSQITNPAILANLAYMPTTFTPTSNPDVGLFSQNEVNTDKEDTTLSRVDANLWKQHLTFRLAWNKQLESNAIIEPGFRQDYPIPLKNLTVSDTFQIGTNKTMEIRYGYNHWPIARHIQATDSSLNQSLYGTTLTNITTAINASGLTRTFLFNVLNSNSPSQSFVDNFAWVHGSHTIKAGATIEHTSSKRYQVEPIIYYYNSIQDLINDNVLAMQMTIGNPGRGYNFTDSGFYAQDDWKVNRRLSVNYGLRYDYYTTFKGPYGLATSNPFGPRVTPGQSIWNANPHDFGPRLGLIYDPTGTGKTVIRAGVAESYNPPEPYWYWDAPFIDPRLSAFPYVPVSQLPANLLPVQFGQYNFQNFTQAVIQNPNDIPPGLELGFNLPQIKHPDERAYNWNLTIQHAVTSNLSFSASYVGNRDLHQFADTVLNLAVDPVVPNAPNVGPANLLTDGATTWYHSMQLSLNQRPTHGYSFDAYFTWSKTMQYDNADGTNEVDNTTQDFNNIAGSIGPKDGNIGHRLTLVHSYSVPSPPMSFARDNGFGRAVFSGWTLQGIMTVIGGQNLNVILGTDVVGDGRTTADRPDGVPGVSQYIHNQGPTVWLNPAAYDAVDPTNQHRFGDLGYDTAVGPGAFTWDLGIHKSFTVWRESKITFRAEMFNWLNHPMFNNPDPNMSDATFGQITSGGPGREVQLALRYDF